MQKEHKQALSGRKIRCILFDLGETLWTRTNEDIILTQIATQRAIQTIRDHVAPEIFAQVDLALLHDQLYHTVVLNAGKLVHAPSCYEPDYGQAVNNALAQFGLPPLEHSVSVAIFEDLRVPSFGSRHLFDDVEFTLQTLKQRGFSLGVVTNRYWGGQPFLADVQRFGLFDYFQPAAIAISADLGIRKPNPAIFLHTLRELNATPEESVMVGDSLFADVAGANKLGIITVWKPKHYLYTKLQDTKLQALQKGTQQDYADNNKLFSYALEQENQNYKYIQDPVKPDIIIKQLQDLLDIFVEVGIENK